MNYYELLEVSPKASPAVIRAAYKSLMQRHHPDKNRNDPKRAEMATLLVQAFEVLSDEHRRAAYDATLRQREQVRQARRQAAVRASTASVSRLGKADGLALLLGVAALVLSAGWLAGMFERAVAPDATQAAPATATMAGTNPRHIPRLFPELSVVLHDRDAAENRNRILTVPKVGVRVGDRDPEAAIRQLTNMAGPIAEKLQNDLAGARFEELIKPDGEQYLATLILNSLVAATANGDNAAVESGRLDGYGPVAVTLPQSFSVR